MITNSKLEWKYAPMPLMKNFYKKTSLNSGWIKVIDEINKPNQKYLKKSFELFLKEMKLKNQFCYEPTDSKFQ